MFTVSRAFFCMDDCIDKNIDTTLTNHVLKATVLLQLGYDNNYLNSINFGRCLTASLSLIFIN